jgi:arginine:pyruvate transaminase
MQTDIGTDAGGRRFADRVARISARPGGGWAIHYEAVERAARGEDVILASIGDHEFPTPAPIVEAAVAALRAGRHHYTPAAGIPELRRAIADFYRRSQQIDVDPAQIVVVPGAQGGLYSILQCLVQTGDEVLVPEPMYVTYPETIQATGAAPVPVPLDPARDFALDPIEVERRIGPHTRALLVNTPHNPTGTVIPRPVMDALVRLCREHGLWLVSDEVYAGMVYGGGHVSALSGLGEWDRICVVESLSKGCAMTGWRIGWTVTPPDLANHLVDLMNVVTYGLPPFVQDAAVEAMRHIERLEEDIAELYRRRAERVCERLAGVPALRVHRPRAGMFVILEPVGFPGDGAAFARALLDEAGVATLPGESFGEAARHLVRLSLTPTDDRLDEACTRILRWLQRTS